MDFKAFVLQGLKIFIILMVFILLELDFKIVDAKPDIMGAFCENNAKNLNFYSSFLCMWC